jgi:Na+-translocating ferredoxin:NAD+ oxidoreductase RnfD subunit
MNTTVEYFYPKKNENYRIFALGYFSTLITLWAIAGKTILGFEQSTAQMLGAAAAAIFTQFILEYIDSLSKNRKPRYEGGLANLIKCLMPAIIPGFAVGFLIYPNELIWPMVFAACLSVSSKVIFRAPVGSRFQHIFNPSNFGITLTLLMFPWIGLAPPYHFTGHVFGIWHWIIPAFIFLSGMFVHGMFTGRLPLVFSWIIGFVLQGLIRSWYFDIGWNVPLVPMTSAAFILFTLYMIPDPATTPLNNRSQIIFGLLVAMLYGVLILNDVVFGLFISLFLVCALRGLFLYLIYFKDSLYCRLLTNCGFCPALQQPK